MKKANKKKSTAKKAKKAKKVSKSVKTKQTSVAKGEVEDGKVDKQPQVKEQAAVARAMFLYVDDAWAQQYFDQNDLRFLEREVFG
jgi:hypothetical protein